MLSYSALDGLLARHVLLEDEQVDEIHPSADGVTMATANRHFAIRSERDRWLVGSEDWVADVVVATREDLRVHGQPERFGFVIPFVSTDADADPAGAEIFVNDPDAIATFGGRLPYGIDPVAYAELLVQFHPYTSAVRTLLTQADDLRRLFELDRLPDVASFQIRQDDDGFVRLSFASCVRYRQPASLPQIDIVEWSVTAVAGSHAEWDAHIAAEGIVLFDR